MEGYRHGLTDEQWDILSPLLREVGGSRGRRPLDNRRWIHAILWLGKTGCPWRDLPVAFGKWRSIHDRFMDWSKSGRWERLFDLIAGTPDATAVFMDSTVFKAAPCASGARKKSSPSPVRKLGRSLAKAVEVCRLSSMLLLTGQDSFLEDSSPSDKRLTRRKAGGC